MIKEKTKEILIANYIIQNTNLLFHKTITDIEIKSIGNVVKLYLYYNPSSKYDIWNLRKEFYKEPQLFSITSKKDKYCAIFTAPTKFKDLIICKMHSLNPTFYEEKIVKCCNEKSQATYK